MAVAKTHPDYWSKRIVRRKYSDSDGSERVVQEWQVYIQYNKRREWFQLATNNKVVAAQRAAKIYQSLKTLDWEETLRQHKGVKQEKKKDCTIGEFIRAVEATGMLTPKTFANYYRWLRAIAAQLKGVADSKKKFDYKGGGLAEWREQVDSIPLSYLTPDRVRKWQKQFVDRAGSDPQKLKKAKHSANSAIRNARSMFSDKILSALEQLEIPKPHPFDGVALLKGGSMAYHSKINPPELIKAAYAELEEAHPEQFKIFLLSLFVGLRRNEIDKLLWESVDWHRNLIRIEATAHFTPKTETSIGNIPVDPGLLVELRKFRDKARGAFVIESKVKPRQGTKYSHYRANVHFTAFTDWLRGQGVDTQFPLHTLRKEYGRLITEEFGIYAASKMLRHSSITVTAAHYADDTRKTVIRMDKLMGTAQPEDADKLAE